LEDLPLFEPSGALADAKEAAPVIDGRIFEDTNLEVIRQLEELAARFHVYEAICTHLYRERIPLQPRLESHPDL